MLGIDDGVTVKLLALVPDSATVRAPVACVPVFSTPTGCADGAVLPTSIDGNVKVPVCVSLMPYSGAGETIRFPAESPFASFQPGTPATSKVTAYVPAA